MAIHTLPDAHINISNAELLKKRSVPVAFPLEDGMPLPFLLSLLALGLFSPRLFSRCGTDALNFLRFDMTFVILTPICNCRELHENPVLAALAA